MLFDYAPLRDDLMKARCVEKSYGIRVESPRDGAGHGDCLSAFSLALILAHEYAGARRGWSITGPADPGFGAGGQLARAYARLEADRARYDREQERLAATKDDRLPQGDVSVTSHRVFDRF